MTNILETMDLCKTYGRFKAVDHVSFDMEEGSFLTLLGPSGSGKTTTLQMIAGLSTPTSGAINLAGRPLVPLPPHKRDIGVVFQNYALFPHMTVFRNVAFPLEARGVPKDEIRRRVGEAIEVVGLPHVEDRYPTQLSGGQQQRVALARAMVFRPKLLLMDEPLGALDKKLREQIQLEIMRLHKELGISIIYVTHDQEEALIMSDQVAVFNEGRIEQMSSPGDIYENPKTLFIADFIGDSNSIPVKFVESRGDACVVEAAGRFRGRSQQQLRTGEGAMMVVRPERVRITACGAGPATGAENSLRARVKSVIYLGKSIKYVVETETGQEITALEQCLQGQGASRHTEGSEVLACWSERESLIFDRAS